MQEIKEIKGNAPVSPFTGCKGWETETEQGLLIMAANAVYGETLLSGLDEFHVVEIGSENGMSASLFSVYAPSAKIACIEINTDAHFKHNLEALELWDENNYAVYGNSAAMRWRDKALELAWDSPQIHLLFIDGDHSYDGALADLRNFAPHVVRGGWLLLHDTACPTNKMPHAQHKDVSRAIETFMGEQGQNLGFRFLFSVDSISVFRRF